MRFYSTIWFALLVLSFLVILESVSSYPAVSGDDAEETIVSGRPAARKHSKSKKEINNQSKNKKNGHHPIRHSSRGKILNCFLFFSFYSLVIEEENR